jgi:hypothetical protein
MATAAKDAITSKQYRALQEGYDFFNGELFDDGLPQLLVTLQRHANSYGYFVADRFQGRSEGSAAAHAHELALNPDNFVGRSDEEIASTLVHEMAHVWQQTHGKPPRRAYHDKQWAGKMKEIGLQPSTTGRPGGKETGQKMTHYILKDAPFAKAFAKLARKGWQLDWQSLPVSKEAKAKNASKTKFTCPTCEQNAWGKKDSKLLCGDCYERNNDIVALQPEPNDDDNNAGASA